MSRISWVSELLVPAPPPCASSGSRTVAALVDAMAARLAPRLGAEAAAEARELLAALHGQPRHWPSVARDRPVSGAAWTAAMEAARQRAAGAPIQYAAGVAAFRHLSLHVDPRVLIPRPETERLVDLVLEAVGDVPGGVAVDVGTGSGAIALALATEGWFDRVIATDVSADALAVAARNRERYAASLRAPVELRHGSLLAPVGERDVRAVVSNPPYIAHREAACLPRSVRDWEPAVALFSGGDGMAATERLLQDAAGVLVDGGLLALEVDARRAGRVAACAEFVGAYVDVRIELDLTGRERFVVARRRRMSA
jgi:release factor glutamine methyltransferase